MRDVRDVKFSWGCVGAGSAILLFVAALANNVRHDTNMAGAADAVENNCLATTDHTCASRTNLAANKSCLVCVYQPCDRFRLKACAPFFQPSNLSFSRLSQSGRRRTSACLDAFQPIS